MAKKPPQKPLIIDAATGKAAAVSDPANLAGLVNPAKLAGFEIQAADLSGLLSCLHAEHAQVESIGRRSAYHQFRAGLILVCIRQSQRGALEQVYKMARKNSGPRFATERTLRRYLQFADFVLSETNLLHVKGKNKKSIEQNTAAQLLEAGNQQLELFASAEDTKKPSPDDIAGSVAHFIGCRDMTEIMASMAGLSDYKAPPNTKKKNKDGGNDDDDGEDREADEADARKMFSQLKTWHQSKTWKLLNDEELDQMRAIGGTWNKECPAIVRGRNKGGK